LGFGVLSGRKIGISKVSPENIARDGAVRGVLSGIQRLVVFALGAMVFGEERTTQA